MAITTSLVTLPPEIRNMVYSTVISNTTSETFDYWKKRYFSGPALSQVNRQLRHELLPMWYSEKSFHIRIYPKTHSEADQVWQDFLDRFTALSTAGTAHGSSSHLLHIQRLEVELWHPAYDFSLYRGLSTPGLTKSTRREYYRTGEYPLVMCNGIYLYFGPVMHPMSRRVGGDDTNWMDRDVVQMVLRTAIVRSRGNFGSAHQPDQLKRFWETYPFDRLVDLTMMIAAECKGAARLVHLRTSFAPLH